MNFEAIQAIWNTKPKPKPKKKPTMEQWYIEYLEEVLYDNDISHRTIDEEKQHLIKNGFIKEGEFN